MNIWPTDTPDQKELFEFFGEPGDNQTKIILPFKMKLSWSIEQTISRFACHKKVHDSLGEIYQAIFEIYGQAEIERLGLNIWGGCLNVRQKRGGKTYSVHSWGAAVDHDPERNKLKWGRDKANFAKHVYGPFWREWERRGWVSLGRENNFDWMHAQAVRVG